MQIWTTQQLSDILSISEMPVRLLRDRELRREFLDQADPSDIAIVSIDDDYLEFLSTARRRGITCPILIISPEPVMYEDDLRDYHTLVLDLKKMGTETVSAIVHYLLFIARQYYLGAPAVPTACAPASGADEKPIDDAAVIVKHLQFLVEEEIPVMTAIDVREQDEEVTARGCCTIKAVRGEDVVLHKFKQTLLLRAMRPGRQFVMFYTHRSVNYSATVVARQAADGEVTVTLPDRLFIARDMRIQPNQAKPVTLYVNIPREPTKSYGVFDISTRGIGFYSQRDLPVNSIFSFTIMLPDPPSIVVTNGIIRFKKETPEDFRYGAEIRPHPWDQDRIAKYIMKREAEIIGLLRNKQ